MSETQEITDVHGEETIEETQAENAPQKRKASSAEPSDDASPKRARIDHHDAPQDRSPSHEASVANDTHQSPTENRRSPVERRNSATRAPLPPPPSKEEEKKRGRRLFGGLLNTLSQTTTGSSQHKRRREIEQRQQEKAQKQRVEDERLTSEKRERIDAIRRREQIHFEEKVMRARHANLLNRAHSIQTRAEPRIYYRPWRLTPEQADAIDDRVSETKALVAREVEEFRVRREQHDREYGRSSRKDVPEQGQGQEQAHNKSPEAPRRADSPPPAAVVEVTAEATTKSSVTSEPGHHKSNHDRVHDELGDIVVEAEEDTVMY